MYTQAAIGSAIQQVIFYSWESVLPCHVHLSTIRIYLIWILMIYCRMMNYNYIYTVWWSMRSANLCCTIDQRSIHSQQDGWKPKHHITLSPLVHMRADKNCTDYITFPTIDKNRVSINGTIAILKQIINILSWNYTDVMDSGLWICDDRFTVCNIAWALYCWQEHQERTHNFSFTEPIAGLFHLQMNVPKMIMYAFDGAARNPWSLRQFAELFCHKTAEKDDEDFHKSNEFFNHVLDVHILACLMNKIKATTVAELHQWLCQRKWPNDMAKLSMEYSNPYIVHTWCSAMIDSLETQTQECINQALENQVALKAAHEAERQSDDQNTEPLPTFDLKKEESRILAELSGGQWDVEWQNAALLVVEGLVYWDSSEACKGGYSSKVEKCIKILMLMFRGRTHFKRSVATWVT